MKKVIEQFNRRARHLVADAADHHYPPDAIDRIEQHAEGADQTEGVEVERREAARTPRSRPRRTTSSRTASTSDGPPGSDPDGELASLVRRIVREEIQRALAERAPAPEGLLTAVEAADRLGVSVSYIRTTIRDGRLPARRIGRAVRVKPEDVDALARRRKSSGARSAHEVAMEILYGGAR